MNTTDTKIKSGRSSIIPGIVLAITAIGLSLLAVKDFVLPYAWVALFFALALLIGIRFTERSNLKALWLNLAVFIIVLGASEIWFYLDRTPSRQDFIRDSSGQRLRMSKYDEVLGYAPVKGQRGSWKRFIGDDLVFDIEYSIDPNGLRPAPSDIGAQDLPCVLFFGGSFTFGSGVEDDETMPYQVGVKSGSRYRIYNFGYRGYGPHQMLAALEQDRVDDVIECRPGYAIYQMIPDHVSRASGLTSWDTHGPRYALGSDGAVVRVGSFNDGRIESFDRIDKYLKRSYLYRWLRVSRTELNHDNVDLFVAIVDRSRVVFEQRYPGSEFHVIYWPNEDRATVQALEKLQSSGIDVHMIGDIFPEFSDDMSRYTLHGLDLHPNALAHRKIADYVVREILDH